MATWKILDNYRTHGLRFAVRTSLVQAINKGQFHG